MSHRGQIARRMYEFKCVCRYVDYSIDPVLLLQSSRLFFNYVLGLCKSSCLHDVRDLTGV